MILLGQGPSTSNPSFILKLKPQDPHRPQPRSIEEAKSNDHHPINTSTSSSIIPTVPTDQLHLMPFSIDHDGPAEISKYFLARGLAHQGSSFGRDEDRIDCLESSFRGRYLHGTRIKIPDGYIGLIASSSSIQTDPKSIDHIDSNSKPLEPIIKTHQTTRRGGASTRRARGRRLFQATSVKRKRQGSNAFIDSDEEEDKDPTTMQDNPSPHLDHEIPKPIRSLVAGPKPGSPQSDPHAGELKDVSSKARDQPQATCSHALTLDSVAPQANRANSKLARESSDVKAIDSKLDDPLSTLKPNSSLALGSDSNAQSIEGSPSIRAPSDSQTLASSSSKVIQCFGTFDRITIWNPDGPVDLVEDHHARSIREWVGLADLLHSLPPQEP